MRADLIISTADTTRTRAILAGQRISINGDFVSASPEGAAKRVTTGTVRVSVPSATVATVCPTADAGHRVGVRFLMTLNSDQNGNRVFRMVPAGDLEAHAVLSIRK